MSPSSPAIPAAFSRRSLLRAVLVTSAGLATGPTFLAESSSAAQTAAAFVDDYKTNLTTNLTAETNAAVRALSGMSALWKTGTAWNTGTVLSASVLRANMKLAVRITADRTDAEAARAFIADRQNQSYAVIAGLGPLAQLYKDGSLAVTGITAAPTGTPATTISDAVPADAPAGAALGAGSTTSALGQVATLVNTVRGSWSSGNPGKLAYQYPRPWRMNLDSVVVDTGKVDEFGYLVYDSPVKVVPQLLRQRGTAPADDGGYPSGHTNAFHLAALAYAYAVPERFQELVTAALDLSNTRIVAGMHSPVDVIGGRILATALAAAILNDPDNSVLKSAARQQALAYFTAQVGDDVIGYAHNGTADSYADHAANRRLAETTLTYGLPVTKSTKAMVVPKGAEVLLETRQPYLSAPQRREVLRTTALRAGHPLLDGTEFWGRLNLFAAADGYGEFAADVAVTMDASADGFAAADVWRNDIGGRGGLTKAGSGTLTLAGDNSYRGGTTVVAGTLTVATRTALGRGAVRVDGGTLNVSASAVKLEGSYRQQGGSLRAAGPARITVSGAVNLSGKSTLTLAGKAGDTVLLQGLRLNGRFASVQAPSGLKAEVTYSATGVKVRLHRN